MFTGAVRRADDPAADGPENLAAAIAAARDPALRLAGATVCVGGEVHAARWATRADATGTPRRSRPRRTRCSGASRRPVLGDRVEPIGPPPPRPPRAAGEPASPTSP